MVGRGSGIVRMVDVVVRWVVTEVIRCGEGGC